MCTGCRRWCGSGDKAVSYSPRLVLFRLPCFIVLQRGVKSLAVRHQGLEDGRALWAAGGGQGDGAGKDQQSDQASARKSCCCLRGLTLFPSAVPERARGLFITQWQVPSVTLLVVLVNHTKCVN